MSVRERRTEILMAITDLAAGRVTFAIVAVAAIGTADKDRALSECEKAATPASARVTIRNVIEGTRPLAGFIK